MRKAHRFLMLAGIAISVGVLCSCGNSSSSTGHGTTTNPAPESGDHVIRVTGSDTMVNLAQAWAENYRKSHPDVSIHVAGGGSGVGIASLIDGIVDIANASRAMKDKEIERAKRG